MACVFCEWYSCSLTDVVSAVIFEASKVGNEITFLTAMQLIIGINVGPATGTTVYDMFIIN